MGIRPWDFLIVLVKKRLTVSTHLIERDVDRHVTSSHRHRVHQPKQLVPYRRDIVPHPLRQVRINLLRRHLLPGRRFLTRRDQPSNHRDVQAVNPYLIEAMLVPVLETQPVHASDPLRHPCAVLQIEGTTNGGRVDRRGDHYGLCEHDRFHNRNLDRLQNCNCFLDSHRLRNDHGFLDRRQRRRATANDRKRENKK